MDIAQIKGIGKELNAFLSQFDDCFARIGSRRSLRAYVHGQLSDLPRKSIEPMAIAAAMKPRNLQCFLSLLEWDHLRLRDKLQWRVAAEHAHPAAIGLIDDTGNPKKGQETAGVRMAMVRQHRQDRQLCGGRSYRLCGGRFSVPVGQRCVPS